MFVEVVKSKIHRVKATQAELNYVGSITTNADLQVGNIIIAYCWLSPEEAQYFEPTLIFPDEQNCSVG